MAYNYTCKRFIKRKNGGQWAKIINEFKWIKPEDSENLTKILKHNKRTSLIYAVNLWRTSETQSMQRFDRGNPDGKCKHFDFHLPFYVSYKSEDNSHLIKNTEGYC